MIKNIVVGFMLFVASVAYTVADEAQEKEQVQHLATCTQLGLMAQHEDVERFQKLTARYADDFAWQVFLAYHIGRVEGTITAAAQGAGVPIRIMANDYFKQLCLNSEV